jgi:hypothetical protein
MEYSTIKKNLITILIRDISAKGLEPRRVYRVIGVYVSSGPAAGYFQGNKSRLVHYESNRGYDRRLSIGDNVL